MKITVTLRVENNDEADERTASVEFVEREPADIVLAESFEEQKRCDEAEAKEQDEKIQRTVRALFDALEKELTPGS